MNINFTEEEIEEIKHNYEVRTDESYCAHTAYLIWDKFKELGLLEE